MRTRPKMSRRQAATGLAAGLVMIAAAPLVWWALQPEPAGQNVTTVNAEVAEALASSPTLVTSGVPGQDSAGSAAASPADNQAPSTEQSVVDESVAEQSAAEPPVAAAAPAPVTAEPVPVPAPPAAPAQIELPTLGVNAEVQAVGVDDAGLMEIPRDVDTVGWYRFGPAPGAAAGSAVLSGHVDDVNQGTGVFGRIGDLAPGDPIRITDANGTVRDFTVVAREEWAKGEVPLDRLFDRAGASRLVLVTCGGSFNSSTLGYDDNIAVTATPIGP